MKYGTITQVYFSPEVEVDGKWETNGLIFTLEKDAERYAQDLYCRWNQTTGHRAVEFKGRPETKSIRKGHHDNG